MEIRIPLIVDDLRYREDQSQITEGVKNCEFTTPDGHLYEIDLAPENAAILWKAIQERDAELERINAEYLEVLADYIIAGRKAAPGRRTVSGVKRAPIIRRSAPAVRVAPAPVAVAPSPAAIAPPPTGYRALSKPHRVAVRAWGHHWAASAGWDYPTGPVVKNVIVEAWKEVNSPVENFAKFPPKSFRSTRKGAKPDTLPFSETE